jgi:hypothetical protein
MLGSKHRAVVALLLLDIFIGAQCFAVAMGEPGSRNGTSSCEEEADDLPFAAAYHDKGILVYLLQI